jgi:hypothetical protein
MRKPIDPHLDARSARAVFEPIDPISVDFRDLNAHAKSYPTGYD